MSIKNEILKQNILTKSSFVRMLLDELHNSGFLDDKSEQEIELITKRSNLKKKKKHCTRNIHVVLNQMKNFEDLELEDFEYWFGLNVNEYINEVNKI